MAKKNASQDRKAKIAQMQRQAKTAERRRTLAIIGAAVVVVAVIGAAVGFAIVTDDERVPGGSLASLGVPAAQAQCDPVTDDTATGTGTHVGPGTDSPETTRVDYATVPPSSGKHFVSPAFPARQFYTVDDRPAMETLVHNLEHGYTILWYDDTATDQQKATLKAVSDKANASTSASDKFIVSAWDDSYGKFPDGKHFALSHWSADPQDLSKQTGHRQLCGAVSGEVVQKFVTAYPRTSAPEPNGQ